MSTIASTADRAYTLNKVRCQRGRALFRERAADIWRVGTYTYRVPSQTDGGIHKVSLKPGEEHCTCPDFHRHGYESHKHSHREHSRHDREPGDFACKHLYAALMAHVKSPAALPASEAA